LFAFFAFFLLVPYQDRVAGTALDAWIIGGFELPEQRTDASSYMNITRLPDPMDPVRVQGPSAYGTPSSKVF